MNVIKSEYTFQKTDKNDTLKKILTEKALEVRERVLQDAGGDIEKFRIVRHLNWKLEYSQVFYDGALIGYLNDDWNNGIFTFEPVKYE